MCRFLLAVDERNTQPGQCRDQAGKRHFRRVGFMCEHRFAEEYAVESDAIESPYQLAVVPCLDRMSETRIVEFGIRIDDRGRNPCARLASAKRRRAVFD